MFDGEKMSKSKGNLYTIQELVDKGFKKNAIRYVLIASHYRQNYNFTFDGLKAAEQAIDKISRCVSVLNEKTSGDGDTVRDQVRALATKAVDGFDEALSDDLNMSKALAAVFELVKEANKLSDATAAEAKIILEAIGKIDSVLGVLEEEKADEIPAEIMKLAEERKQAKLNKDWARADAIRDEVTEKGFVIEDMPGNEYRITK
jgi:cysteinyl-tRNA synthetase